MRIVFASLLSLVAACAVAQTAHIEHPGYLELGVLLPDYRGARFGTDVGVAGGLGYSFAERGDFRLSGELRGAFHLTSLGGGGDAGVSAEDGNLTVGSAFVGLRHRHHGTGLFAGLGLGIGHAAIDGGDDRTGALVAVEAGYDFASHFYLGARYQFASVDALRGATLSLGLRF